MKNEQLIMLLAETLYANDYDSPGWPSWVELDSTTYNATIKSMYVNKAETIINALTHQGKQKTVGLQQGKYNNRFRNAIHFYNQEVYTDQFRLK